MGALPLAWSARSSLAWLLLSLLATLAYDSLHFSHFPRKTRVPGMNYHGQAFSENDRLRYLCECELELRLALGSRGYRSIMNKRRARGYRLVCNGHREVEVREAHCSFARKIDGVKFT